jgi:YbbR domain-containing protein
MGEKMKRLDDLLTSPMFLRGISVLIAFFLWFYVGADRMGDSMKTLRCKVEYLNVPPQTVLKTDVTEVDVHVSGMRTILATLGSDAIACEVDTRGLSVGKYRLAVRTVLPKDVKLIDISPSQIDIEMIRFIDRLIPVEIEVREGLPSGVYLESVEIIPKDVTVRGVEKDLAKVGGARVRPTLEELQRGGELLLPVDIAKSEEFEKDVTVEPKKIRLRGVLVKGIPQKAFPIHVNLVGKPADDFDVRTIMSEPAEAMIQGPQPFLNGMQAVETESLDIEGISGDREYRVRILKPADETVRVVSPEQVRVSVSLKKKVKAKTLSRIAVGIEGKSVYPAWSVDPSFVNVTLEGTPSDLATLESADLPFRAVVNVTNVISRKLLVPVLIRNIASKNVRVLRVEPQNVTVTAIVD